MRDSISTGEKKVLTQYGDWNDDDAWTKSGFTDLNVISPDGKHIAFTYYTAARLPNATVELRVINSDGTGQRTLYPGFPFCPWHGHSIHPLRSEQHVLSR